MTCTLLPYETAWGRCDRCGLPLGGRQKRWCGKPCENSYWRNHYWDWARRAALRRDHNRCVRCGTTQDLEVNHIVPRRGRGYRADCGHHLTNLETLCHDHHLVETRRQRAARKALR